MNYKSIFFEVLRSMRANKLRTALTMIGIIIGIGAVVAIMSTAESVTATVSSEIEKTGLNKISLSRRYGNGTPRNLDDTTMHFLESLSIPDIKGYEGNTSISTQTRDYKTGETAGIYVNGATEETIADMNLEILAGRGIVTTEENASKSRVAIVNSNLVKKFFYGDPDAAIGEMVKIGGASFKIIGVYKNPSPFSDHLAAVAPIRTLMTEPFNENGYDQISVILDPGGDANSVREQIMAAMLKARGYTDEEKADFSLSSPRQELDTFKQFMNAASIVIALIAAISLIVGGVGIMNIMLVTVTERTKEIGLMRSLGAKKRDIVRQFLIESITLTVFGGILGVGLGIFIAFAAISIINMFDEMPTFLFSISIMGIIVSLVVSILIGLIFGLYPARRASKLSPVEALRRE